MYFLVSSCLVCLVLPWACLVLGLLFSCVALPCLSFLLLPFTTRENSNLPGRETKLNIQNDKNMSKNMTEIVDFRVNCRVFLGPILRPWEQLVWKNRCVFRGTHFKYPFLVIFSQNGVPKKPKTGGLVLALFWNPLFSFFWEDGSPKCSRNGVPFRDPGPR